MVSLLILSHSPKIAEGIRDLALEMAGEAPIRAIGGTKDGTLGADFDATLAALEEATAKGDVIAMADLGSTRMTVQMALESLPEEQQAKVHLSDAAIVEGGVVAAVAMGAGLDAASILEQLEEFVLNKE